MPKRSNEFQKLMFLLKKQLGNGATVTESKVLRDLVTGQDREVDICVETEVASHCVIVSIECRDRSRAADVGWVQEMKAKHERLPTNALVLISKKGFSAEAIRMAKTYNIETLTFEETTEENVDRIFGNLDSLWAKLLTLTPTKVVVGVSSTETLPEENVVVLPDNAVYDEGGKLVAPIRDLIQSWLHAEQVIEAFGKKADQSHKSFVVGWRLPKGANGESLYLQKLNPHILRLIEQIEVNGACKCEVSEFPLRHGSLGRIQVSWGEGDLMGKNAILLASKGRDGVKRISISL